MTNFGEIILSLLVAVTLLYTILEFSIEDSAETRSLAANIEGTFNSYMTSCRNIAAQEAGVAVRPSDLVTVFWTDAARICDSDADGTTASASRVKLSADPFAAACFEVLLQSQGLLAQCDEYNRIEAACEQLELAVDVLTIIFAPLFFLIILLIAAYWDVLNLYAEQSPDKMPSWLLLELSKKGVLFIIIFGFLFAVVGLMLFVTTECPGVSSHRSNFVAFTLMYVIAMIVYATNRFITKAAFNRIEKRHGKVVPSTLSQRHAKETQTKTDSV